jgi:adenylate cyclase
VPDSQEDSAKEIKISYKEVVQSLRTAVALVDESTDEILFENAKFFQWFDPKGLDAPTLADRVPDIKMDRAKTRLKEGRGYSYETSVIINDRDTPVRLSIRNYVTKARPCYLVEVDDISKEMEVQFMLDSYSKMAEKNARELENEKARVEKLLLNIMPKSVVDELQQYGTATPGKFDECSVIMLDFVGFTDMALASDPSSIVSELNDIFSAFDRITEMFGCERLRTIGDAYMAVSGVPEPSPEHAQNIARVALRMRRYLERRNAAHAQEWRARIGINSGPVIGSLVGIQKYVYDLFGPGVNLAARMESASEPMKITCNQDTYELLRNDFVLSDRGEQEIKGFGTQHLYFLESEVSRHF